VSGCVGRVPVHCFAWGSIVLLRRYCTALMWMKSYLNDRTRRVAVDSVVSNAMHLQCGVLQSSVFGPRLYCILQNQSVKFADAIIFVIRVMSMTLKCTKMYLVIKPLDNWKNISRRLETCLSDVNVWMSLTMFRLNQDNT
jgi:hypothetical protein